jgi:hypothetical protein
MRKLIIRKAIFSLLFISICHIAFGAFTPPLQTRAIIDLDNEWKFQRSDVSGASAIRFILERAYPYNRSTGRLRF